MVNLGKFEAILNGSELLIDTYKILHISYNNQYTRYAMNNLLYI